LRERNSIPRTYEPVELNGEKTFHVEDRFSEDFSEGLYGLGQHQSGLFNYRGATVELGQNNTDVAIPLLLSTKGYALMWNKLVDRLQQHYGAPAPPPSTDPLELIIWENIAYLANDKRRAEAFASMET
jgi:alpha-glucosidase (family GH31 glycosyl hydrolase)